MHCKDTILRTQNNWPYSKLIPNSGINAISLTSSIIEVTKSESPVDNVLQEIQGDLGDL